MPNATQEIFDITASTYDADRAKLIPCYDAFYRRTTDLIVGGAERVLDLGAGTGLLSTFRSSVVSQSPHSPDGRLRADARAGTHPPRRRFQRQL